MPERLQRRSDDEYRTSRSGVNPFLKWAGGKRWALSALLSHVPKQFDRYIEPFLGGASLFFGLRPKRAMLSDMNSDLINAYVHVRDFPAELQRWLVWLERHHSSDFYYRVRERSKGGAFWRALRFIYLNRTCWNGLYRVNLRGQFNVPIGTKTAVGFEGGLSEQSAALRDAKLMVADFEVVLAEASHDDFVYIDPPYTVRHNNNGFVKYNERIFGWKDQERLRAAIASAQKRGANVLVSNAAHPSIRDLYKGLGEVIDLQRNSVLAASSLHRRPEKEVLIKCF